MIDLADKFDKTSIYDLDFKITDNDGEEQTFTFKPLPFKFYPKTYALIGKLQKLQGEKGLSDEEQIATLIDKLDEETVALLLELEKVMVEKSYPTMDEEKIELFVTSNMFQLMEPLIQLISRQEIVNPRKADVAQK